MGDLVFNPMVAVYVALDSGYFDQEGLNVELVRVATTVEGIQSVATGQFDFHMTGPDPALFNALERGIDVKVLASAAVTRVTDRTAVVLIRSDLIDSGAYTGPQDLKGKKIGVPAEQSQFYVERFIARGNLTAADVEFIQLSIPDSVAALTTKAIDAAWVVEPLATSAIRQGVAKPVAATGELYTGAVAQALIMSPAFGQTQSEAARRFTVGYVRGLRDYYHAFVKNDGPRDTVVAALINHTLVKDPAVYEVIGLQSVDPNATMTTQSWDDFQDYFLKRGLQKQRLDLTRYIDRSYQAAAVERLGTES